MQKSNKLYRKALALLALAAGGGWAIHAYSEAATPLSEHAQSLPVPTTGNIITSAPSSWSKVSAHTSVKTTTQTTIEVVSKTENHQPVAEVSHSFESSLTDEDLQQQDDSTAPNQASERQQPATHQQPRSQAQHTATIAGAERPSADNIEVRLEAIKYGAGGENQPPRVNAEIQRQLQSMVDKWAFTQDMPAYYRLPIDALFDDPDGDPLTTRAAISIAGMHVINSPLLNIQGVPTTSTAQPELVIEARDNHHGSDDAAWVKARFKLDPIEHLPSDERHPLVGDTLYRLEAGPYLAGVYYNYDVVYCEAWQLRHGIVYFASADNKTHCPMDVQLQEIGQYTITKNNDVVITSTTSQLNAPQRWVVKKEYDSSQQLGVKNLFTTVYDGKHIESYTLQKNKSAMEARLNVKTGESAFQMQMFDYLFPQPDGSYVHGIAGNYIFDYGQPLPYTRFDSDLNLQSSTINLSCDQLLRYWQSSVLAGVGETGDIISTSVSPTNNAPIDCGEAFHPGWKKNYVYMNLEYQNYDFFVPGEIYSYVLKPKPEYAALVETFKINLHYNSPLATDGI
ncbi:hypothetical protein [Photobacterium nomapromontoriensis]|uniref:hypothetical protein n=1 Tax=Photobacterium nomapromontoriensis TaxID=2910237 RepID=UPI003D12339B